jgi:alkylation response protein AidB-like acyl-CoA dehydrogenase
MHNLTNDELDWRRRARALAAAIEPSAAETDRSERYPWPVIARMNAEGFLGMTIPKAYGGGGRSYLETVLVIEELAKACAVAGRIAVETNMGAIGAILAYGDEAQRQLATRLVLAGDKPAICITEFEAGSAATDMTTTATRRGDRWIVNGTKTWITGGGVSKLHLIFARAIENGRELGIGGFIVVREKDGDAPGFAVTRRIPSMGLRGMPEAELAFTDLAVPDAMVLGPPGGFASGFGALMDAYNAQRVGAAAVALGIAAGAYERALEFVQQREQFGRPIAEFQGLQWMLADMSIALEASRALVYGAARSAGPAGFPDRLAAAQAKVHASEMAIKVTNDALQLWGAAGYSRDNPMERHVRDARMFTIAGGTAQVLRNVIASRLLGRRLPQTRDGYLEELRRPAAE